MVRINAIVKKRQQRQKISLLNLDLDNNDEYDCAWALVNTGAGVNCGDKKQFEDVEPVDAPIITLTTADGKIMPNKGAFKVTTTSQEGVIIERVFYDAPVEMPILSVAQISKEGLQGSDATFRRNDGFIEDNETHVRQKSVNRKGVYCMK